MQLTMYVHGTVNVGELHWKKITYAGFALFAAIERKNLGINCFLDLGWKESDIVLMLVYTFSSR